LLAGPSPLAEARVQQSFAPIQLWYPAGIRGGVGGVIAPPSIPRPKDNKGVTVYPDSVILQLAAVALKERVVLNSILSPAWAYCRVGSATNRPTQWMLSTGRALFEALGPHSALRWLYWAIAAQGAIVQSIK
jgi:hypothetical protein